MTRLRQIAMAGLAAIAIGGVASSASAMETGTFQNRLNGATIGLPLGAAPPPGLYTGLETAYLGMLAGSSITAPAPEISALGLRVGLCRTCPRLPKRCHCSGCQGGTSSVPPTRLRSCKRSMCSRPAAATYLALHAASLPMHRHCAIRSPVAGSCTPTPSSNRSPCLGTSAAAGSLAPPSPSRLRTARARRSRRTRTTGLSSLRWRSPTWATTG